MTEQQNVAIKNKQKQIARQYTSHGYCLRIAYSFKALHYSLLVIIFFFFLCVHLCFFIKCARVKTIFASFWQPLLMPWPKLIMQENKSDLMFCMKMTLYMSKVVQLASHSRRFSTQINNKHHTLPSLHNIHVIYSSSNVIMDAPSYIQRVEKRNLCG